MCENTEEICVSPSDFRLKVSKMSHSVRLTVDDRRGASADDDITVRVVDSISPTIICDDPNGSWQSADVQLTCRASDGGSGLADPGLEAFVLWTDTPSGTESDNVSTGSRDVCDGVGNCATAGPIGGNRIDKKAPTISINISDGVGYSFGQMVAAEYSCGDSGSGVASCVGTVPSGESLDTSSLGVRTLSVTAIDHAGNNSSDSVTYRVVPAPTMSTVSVSAAAAQSRWACRPTPC